MSAENTNPFVLPGLGQSGDLAQNPLLAGMEMMRKAWQGFAEHGGLEQSGMAAPMSPEELDKRIADLRTVENWLRMNLSMLNNAIQGLEVQRATITTLKSFVDTASSAQAGQAGQSALDAMLKMWPASAAAAQEAGENASQAVPASAQAWWDMLKGQFDTLAAATAATMQGAEAASTAPSKKPAAKKTARKSAVKSGKTKAATAQGAATRKRATGTTRKKAR
jgi:hypothetical protein